MISSGRVEHGVARNILTSGVGQAATMGLAMLTTIITARWLGASGRGVLSLVTTSAATAAVVFSLGSYQVVTTFLARRALTVRAVALFGLLLAAGVGFVVGLGLLWLVGPEKVEQWVVYVVAVGAALVVLSSVQTAAAAGLARLDLAAANTISTAGVLVLGYGIAASAGSHGYEVAVACTIWLAAQAFGDAIGWAGLFSVRSIHAVVKSDRAELIRHALSSYPAVLVGQLGARADILVLGLLSSAASVGVYSTAVVIGSVLFVIPSAIGASVARPFAMGDQDASRLARKSAIGAALGTLAFAPPLLAVLWFVAVPLLGQEFAGVTRLVAILTPGMTLFSTAFIGSQYFATALRRPIVGTAVAGTSLIVDILLLVPLGTRFGAEGAAISSSAGYAAGGVVNIALLWWFTGAGPSVTVRESLLESVKLLGESLSDVKEVFR